MTGKGEVQFWLGEIGVMFDLQHRRMNFGISQTIQNQRSSIIRDANMFNQPLMNRFLHLPVRVLQRSLCISNLALPIICPAGGISNGGIDVFQGNGEVNVY